MRQNVKFIHIYNQNFGGYFIYFKLLFFGQNSLMLQLKRIFKSLSFVEKNILIFKLFFQIPYWMFIKPLFKIFSIRTKYVGNFEYIEDVHSFKYKASKLSVFKIIGIPFFVLFSTTLNKKDVEIITKLNTENLIILKK